MSTTVPHPIETLDIETTRWRIDPARSSVQFRVPSLWGLTRVNGRFTRYHGTLSLSESRAVELTIDANSLDTHNFRRDKHLRSADFFDVENHAQVRFVSDTVAVDGQRLTVRGQLVAAGKRIPLEVDVALRRDGDELLIDATTQADHRRLGMTWSPLGIVRTPSELAIHGRLVPDAQ